MIVEQLFLNIKKTKAMFFLMTVLLTTVFFLLNFLFTESGNVHVAAERLRTMYDGKEYFFVAKEFEEGDSAIFYHSLDRLNDLKNAQHELMNQQIFEYYLQIRQSLELVEFEDNISFIANYREGSEDNSYEMFGQVYFQAKAYYVSQNIIEKFGLRVSSGQLLENEDYIYRHDYVPVIVGHNYTANFSVGDTFQGFYWNKSVDFKIIGFLEENESMLIFSQDNFEVLDDYILVPALEFPNDPADIPDEDSQPDDERLMQEVAYSSYLNFIITMSEGYELNDFAAYYDSIRSRYNIPDYYIADVSMFTVRMLQLSNAEYYDSILFLVCCIAVFSFICLCVYLSLNSLRSLNAYYTHILLGAGYFRIYLMILSEAFLIVATCHLLAFFISGTVSGTYSLPLVAAGFLLSPLAAIPATAIVRRLTEKDFLWRKE